MADMQRRLVAILAADVVGYSRLVGIDETGTIAAVRRLQDDLISPGISAHNGRLVKLMGDGVLAEFPSVVEAVTCAAELQLALADAAQDDADDRKIKYRIGINLGDVVIDGDDIYGDGVNVAARLEGIAAPGGICLSDMVYQSVRGKTDYQFEDAGKQALKNIETPIRVWHWINQNQNSAAAENPALEQEVKFCTAPDGVTIAYASVGSGPPLVKAPNWMHHLEYDWQSPVWGHLLHALAANHTLVRFDQRCNGLSDWHADEVTFETMVDDMEAVIEAAGLDRFPIIGISQGCAFSIAYALRHPEKVSRLVLYGGFAVGAAMSKSESQLANAKMQTQMILQGWGQDNPAFRQFFTSLFVPGASREQMDWFNELQRRTVSPENAVRLRHVANHIDIMSLLPKLTIPTLVLHCRDDGIVPFEAGRRMAASIPNARFVALEGKNHLILEDEPAWPRFLEEVRGFLAQDDAAID